MEWTRSAVPPLCAAAAGTGAGEEIPFASDTNTIRNQRCFPPERAVVVPKRFWANDIE